MSSHTVALDSEAYAALKAMKRSEESFSDVVKRIAKPHGSILEFAGAWKDLPQGEWEEMEASYRRSRKAAKRQTARINKSWDAE